jgi:hypothetical protein
MSPEKQRIAIARHVGWTLTTEIYFKVIRRPGEIDTGFCCGLQLADEQCWAGQLIEHEEVPNPIPDYLNDLNACREMELSLDDERNLIPEEDGEETEWDRYIWTLEQIVEPLCAEEDIYRRCICASPAERCEAFLRTKGSWEGAA